ncbi:MAG: DciA family protein [Treponema sp.]
MSGADFISCSDMIVAAFGSIEKCSLEKNNKLFNSWKKIITGISNFGQNLYEHTSIVDIKNGVLLLETDHPGWIQILQMNGAFILRGLKMYAPELKVTSLSYRLKGSNAKLYNVDYDTELRRESQKMNEKISEEEKKLSRYGAKSFLPQDKAQIPQELNDKLNSLKQSLLTKNKNK